MITETSSITRGGVSYAKTGNLGKWAIWKGIHFDPRLTVFAQILFRLELNLKKSKEREEKPECVIFLNGKTAQDKNANGSWIKIYVESNPFQSPKWDFFFPEARQHDSKIHLENEQK